MDCIKEKINSYCLKLMNDQNIPYDRTDYSDVNHHPEAFERTDLRQLKCITIDCDDTKDMDDAVSLFHDNGMYHLMIHIADVSAYVPKDSQQDIQAMARGTSIYFPFMTVGMLASGLSDDLCSLNPNQDRKAVTVSLLLNEEGMVIRYDIFKSLIRSKVKGSYSEVNQILKKTASAKLYRKYEGYVSMLKNMHTLDYILRNRRERSGFIAEEEPERKITVRNGHICIDFSERGAAEKIIEEFMILANRTVAEYMIKNDLPCIYRIQTAENEYAEYTSTVSGHFSLALDSYTHFTSPIRRLADLKVHQVLTAFLSGMPVTEIHNVFDKHLTKAAIIAAKRSRHAKQITHSVEKYCIHEYFMEHPGEIYKGIILDTDYHSQQLILIPSLGLSLYGETRKRMAIGSDICCTVIPLPCSNQCLARDVFL